jgi:uncharacterized membrane protein
MATQVKETAERGVDDAQQAGTDAGDQENGLFSELKDTARDAALSVLKPVVSSAAKSAADYAVTKGPELVKDRVAPKVDAAGGVEQLAKGALSNMGPAGKVASKLGVGGKIADSITGGDGEGEAAEADATGSGRRMPVQQAMDVAVPLETAYNQWTQFEDYPEFMHRVDGASQEDDAHVTFTEKVWGFSRDFEAEILEQRPNERIVWRSTNGLKHAGVVTFHELAERLTRVEVTVDFKPESLFQKFARGARYSKRAIRADMHRFKAYIEMSEEEEGAWRGRIEDGEVVEQEEQEQEGATAESEGAEEEEPEAAADEEPEEAEDEEAAEEPEAEAEEEPGEAEEEEPEAEASEEAEEPRPRRRTGASSGRGGGRQRSRSRPSAKRSQSGGRKRRSPQKPGRPQRRRATASSR